MCSLVAYDIKQPTYEDEESSIGYRLIPKHVTIEALEAWGDTPNFIEIWLKLLDHNYELRCRMYNKDTKEMFKKMPTRMTKALSPKKKSSETYDINL